MGAGLSDRFKVLVLQSLRQRTQGHEVLCRNGSQAETLGTAEHLEGDRMSTMLATCSNTPSMGNGVLNMTTQQLRPELETIVEDILGLRALATSTGFMTFKSQREIRARLTPADQAAVGRALAKREKEQTK